MRCKRAYNAISQGLDQQPNSQLAKHGSMVALPLGGNPLHLPFLGTLPGAPLTRQSGVDHRHFTEVL